MQRLFSFVLILLFSTNTFGQTSTTQLPEASKVEADEIQPPPQPLDPAADIKVNVSDVKEKKVERIEVTGSHIRRINTETASPVQTVTRKDIERTGYTSVADVLRDTGVNSFGSTREDSGSNAAGVAHVNLRGLGETNTLVLLNGQRLPSDAVTGAVDLNLIPMAAVERIEVLKDGASAIYGSDALGGVVNIITRKDFSGTEFAFKQSVPQLEGGKKREISIINGINKGRINMVNVLNYRDNDVIYSKDRDWTNKGVSGIGSPGSYHNAGQPWNADANCPPEMIQHTANGDICQFKYTDYSTELPALEQLSIMSETNAELSSKVKAKFRMGASQKKAEWSYAPSPDNFTIPGAVADTLGPGGTPLPGAIPGQDLLVRYRVKELGTRDTVVTTHAYNLLGGVGVEVGKGWEVETNIGHNRILNKDEGVSGYALTRDINAAIASGAFNPFAPEGQRGSIEATRYKPHEDMTSELSSADLKASGEFGHLPAGRFGLAVGTTFTFQKFKDQADDLSVADEVFGNAGSTGGGQRDTKAVYTELSIPVTSKVEMQIAGRYDKYSDFGDTFNPKAAVLYHPAKTVLLRASAGTGFKAPLLKDLYASSAIGFPTMVDPTSCAREQAGGGPTTSCTPQQYEVHSGGNSGLKEEKSLSLGAGVVYEPSRDFNVSLDTFYTKLNNVVDIDYNDALLAEKEMGNAYMQEKGVNIHRDVNGVIEYIDAPLQNLAAREVTGMDIGTSYRFWKFQVGDGFSKLFYFKEEGFPGMGLKNKLGNSGRPEWRNTASLTFFATEKHSIGMDALTTPGQRKYIKEEGKTKDYTTFDMQYNWKWMKNGTLTAGVKNVFGTVPPIDYTNPNSPLDGTIYDQIGRQYYTGMKATF